MVIPREGAGPMGPHLVYGRHEPDSERERSALPDGPVFVLRDGECLLHTLRDGGDDNAPACSVPRLSELTVPDGVPIHEIATYRGEPVYTWTAPEASAGLDVLRYRELFGLVSDAELALLGRAVQIHAWDETSRYCPRCGEATVPAANEPVKRCESCAHIQYPRVTPAMIVGVVRGRQLLLAQSPRFHGRFHSVLAGFVEPGETVEECVHREVWEEVGIRVRDVAYFGSQPWPFPHTLMLGFTATYDSGEIRPDPDEIANANWYDTDALPTVPSEVSISGRIIQSIVRRFQ